MGNISVIGKVHIKDINALREWHASGDFKKWHKVNWSPELAAYHHIKWEDTDQIAFYQMQDQIPGLSKSLDRTGSWMSDLLEMAGYLQSIGLSLNLLYLDDQHRFAVISGADTEKAYTLPCQFLDIEEYKDYSDYTPDQMCSIAGETASSIIPSGQGFSSVTDVKKDIYSKEEKLKEQENALKKLQQEQEEKLEEMKRQLMEQYRPLREMIEKKQAELEEEKKKLENQLTVLDTQIYAIRCITGEVVDFTQLVNGKHADADAPVVIYQKLRYMDEELGKYLALYNVDGDDAGLFEDILKNREDLRDLFCPGEKAVSFVKVSRSGIGYKNHEKFANMLQKYEKYHGHTIGILIKDGENLYMGWTDEDRIDIHDENIFFAPQEETVSQETEETCKSTSREEKISRFFIFALLQGIINDGKLIRLPEKVTVIKPNPYVVFSMADGWIEDNTYGSWKDILDSSNGEIKKGDMVLVMQRITRDDVYDFKRKYEAYNNDRGRGEKNRTHDVSISDCTVYPINLVDKDECYNLYYLDYPYAAVEHKYNERPHKNGGITYEIRYEYIELQGPPVLTKDADVFENGLHSVYGKITEDNIENFVKWKEAYYHEDSIYRESKNSFFSHDDSIKCFRREFYKADHIATEAHYFISEEKKDSGYDWRLGRDIKKSRANMEVYEGEFLNLTYLDSVRLRYAIINRKVTAWKIGGCHVDYAAALQYLNKALEYLDEKEKKEKEMLLKYMDKLPENWQVDLTLWRKEHGYHALTETRAKKWALERK